MKLFHFALLLLIFSCTQPSNKKQQDLSISIYNLDIPAEKELFEGWKRNNIIDNPGDTIAKRYESNRKFKVGPNKLETGYCDYEDEDFAVYAVCGGEWGGVLLFEDKKDPDKTYLLPCTCPKMIERRDGKYIVTATLAHMGGYTAIRYVDNPRMLPLPPKGALNLDLPNPSSQYGDILLDAGGITANVFFPHGEKNYLIYSKSDTTYVGEISNHKIIHPRVLLNYGTWSYYDALNKIKNGIYISNIDHRETTINGSTNLETTKSVIGAIYIKQDSIILGYKYSTAQHQTTDH
jgi:hypothetical protein